MSDLIAELDEAMRQERLQKFWDENGSYIIILVVGTILMTGIFSGYNAWKDNAQKRQTTALIAALEAPDFPQNIETNDKSIGDLNAIAKISAAASFIGDDQQEEALNLYNAVVEDKSAPDNLRDLSRLMVVRLTLSSNSEADTDTNALLEILKPVLNGKSPFKPQAQIEAASIHANLNTVFETAIALLDDVLETPDLPPTLYSRAQNLKHLYTLQNTRNNEEETQSVSQ